MLSCGNIRNLISILVGWVPAMVETVKHVTGSPKKCLNQFGTFTDRGR